MSGKGKRGAAAPLANSSDEDEPHSDHEVDPGSKLKLRDAEGLGTRTSLSTSLGITTPSAAAELLSDEGGNRPVLAPSPCSSTDYSNTQTPDASASFTESDKEPPQQKTPDPPHQEHDYALADHDYENVSSPGSSSTASEPSYVRQPGFTHHAHEVLVTRPKIKKKKTQSLSDTLYKKEPTPPKAKIKREPLPMRLRALPQSFWQQPNRPQNIPPSSNFPLLPPVIIKDSNTEEPASEMRPVTPPAGEEKDQKCKQPPVPPGVKPERNITVANTDLLFRLFDGVEKEKKKSSIPGKEASLKRRKPRKVIPVGAVASSKFVSGQDPYLVECVSEKLFPQLSLQHSVRTHSIQEGGTSLQLVTLREGDKCIALPALSIDQNYSQMLSELVMHI